MPKLTEKQLARKAAQQAGYHRKLRRSVLSALGGVCVKCGFADERALQIDHVHGGGHQERTRLKTTTSFLRRVRAAIASGDRSYQLLCANCNWIKRVEQGEYG